MDKRFKIYNVQVYGLKESILASRYPMLLDVKDLSTDDYSESEKTRQIGKAVHLSVVANQTGQPHDCYLKGVVVQFDVTYPQYWALQEGRYHFIDIVSSTSKMHMLIKADIDASCNEYVDDDIKFKISKMQEAYRLAVANHSEDAHLLFMRLLSNLPMGYMLTMRLTTNYLQLKTIYKQRCTHRLPEWRVFCDWVRSLPMMDKLLSDNYEIE